MLQFDRIRGHKVIQTFRISDPAIFLDQLELFCTGLGSTLGIELKCISGVSALLWRKSIDIDSLNVFSNPQPNPNPSFSWWNVNFLWKLWFSLPLIQMWDMDWNNVENVRVCFTLKTLQFLKNEHASGLLYLFKAKFVYVVELMVRNYIIFYKIL